MLLPRLSIMLWMVTEVPLLTEAILDLALLFLNLRVMILELESVTSNAASTIPTLPPVTSPVQSNNLTEGYHSVKIRSQDGVGNTDDSPASFGWTVDTIAPLTSINSVIDGNSSEILTGGNTSSNTVRVEFSGTDSGVGVNHFECSLDNSEFAACTSPTPHRQSNRWYPCTRN